MLKHFSMGLKLHLNLTWLAWSYRRDVWMHKHIDMQEVISISSIHWSFLHTVQYNVNTFTIPLFTDSQWQFINICVLSEWFSQRRYLFYENATLIIFIFCSVQVFWDLKGKWRFMDIWMRYWLAISASQYLVLIRI